MNTKISNHSSNKKTMKKNLSSSIFFLLFQLKSKHNGIIILVKKINSIDILSIPNKKQVSNIYNSVIKWKPTSLKLTCMKKNIKKKNIIQLTNKTNSL